MREILQLINRYGYSIIFANVFLEAVGLPLPAVPVLIASGAACALGSLTGWKVLVISLVAMLMGDSLLYLLGRKTGWWILGFLCRVSATPETCILRSAESFYKRGRATLVFAKFIPGINTMAPPLAGSLRMKARQFFSLDLMGSLIYILPFFALGYFLSEKIEEVVSGIHSVNQILLWAVLLLIVGYALYRIRVALKNRLYRAVPRVSVQELLERLSNPDMKDKVVLADARSHGYYDAGAKRIKGSIRLEPAQITEQLHQLPKDKEIYLYCT